MLTIHNRADMPLRTYSLTHYKPNGTPTWTGIYWLVTLTIQLWKSSVSGI